jgi:hypothetical protein
VLPHPLQLRKVAGLKAPAQQSIPAVIIAVISGVLTVSAA